MIPLILWIGLGLLATPIFYGATRSWIREIKVYLAMGDYRALLDHLWLTAALACVAIGTCIVFYRLWHILVEVL